MPFPKICRGCSVPFTADRRRTEFHSRKCYAQWRESTPAWQAAKRRGQVKSAATQHQKSRQIYAQKAHGCETKGQAFRAGHRDGYQLGWKRGERVGFADGYEAAITRHSRTSPLNGEHSVR